MNEVCESAMSGRPLEPIGELKEAKRSKSEVLREYEVRIKVLNVGCVISVGCKDIAFSSLDEGIIALNKYFSDPMEEVKKWNKKFKE